MAVPDWRTQIAAPIRRNVGVKKVPKRVLTGSRSVLVPYRAGSDKSAIHHGGV